MTAKRKFLVIGSNSFSGASFIDHLLKSGYETLGLSRSPEANPIFLPYKWRGDAENFRFFQLDLNHDLDKLGTLMKSERPSFVINFAAQSMVGQSWKNPEHWFQTNLVSSVRMHDELRKLDFLEKYIHVTTPEVYGSTEGWIDEKTHFNPSTPYAVSRAACDFSLQTYFDAYSFPVVFTRAANVFGPGQQLYRIIPRTILFILLGKKLSLQGGGRSRRSFIHMDDVSDATLKICEMSDPGETYHISTNELISIRLLVEKICDLLGVKFEDCVEVSEDRLGKDAAYMLDSSKIRERFDWKENINLEQGLRQCIKWVQRHLEDLRTLPHDYIHKP